jgi:hypothetical protein
MSRGELRDVAHAVRHHWPIPDKLREAAVARVAMILADPNQPTRMHLAAVRALADLDGINTHREENEIARDHPTPSTIVTVSAVGIDLASLRRMTDDDLRRLLEQRDRPQLPAPSDPPDDEEPVI